MGKILTQALIGLIELASFRRDPCKVAQQIRERRAAALARGHLGRAKRLSKRLMVWEARCRARKNSKD